MVEPSTPSSSFARVLVAIAALCAVLLGVAMFVLWPRTEIADAPELSPDLVRAVFVDVDDGGCEEVVDIDPTTGGETARPCKHVTFTLDEPQGSTVSFDVPVRNRILDVEQGDAVRVAACGIPTRPVSGL